MKREYRFDINGFATSAFYEDDAVELLDTPVTPCGACRQVMAQYQLKSGLPMMVLLIGAHSILKFEKVDDLLPFIFDSI